MKFIAYTELRARIRKESMDSKKLPVPPIYLNRVPPSLDKNIKMRRQTE
jgi:hypothetical protein